MERFHIIDIILMLGIPYPTNGNSSYYVKCPCCDEKESQRHLNINLRKDVFRCPRCGVSGGVFDLYSLYTGTPRDKAYKEICKRLNTKTQVSKENIKTNLAEQQAQTNEYPLNDIEIRHATYTAMLGLLSLAPDHRENLLGRGLTDEDIIRLGYKSTPVAGMRTIAKQLLSDGHYLAGVPGFYRTNSGEWTFIHDSRGILMPVRNKDGLIQGLQIRRDSSDKRKYRWVSSGDRPDGCKAESWTHLSGGVMPIMLITEGPLKADVINALTGMTIIAVPGVNALTHLKTTLSELKSEGLREVKTAFDMDYITNKHVQDALESLMALLDVNGFKYSTYLWDPNYKGLDDYIWECCMERKHENKMAKSRQS